jgi:gluconate 2-dehydrogenase alpha chain
LIRKSNFTARDNSEVVQINLDRSGKRATGVTFVDTGGVEWEQPADLVILSAYTMFNVQMLLHSKIGTPYDPVANKGVIGRNFTHQTISSVNGFFDNKKFNFNPFIASGSIGMCIDEFNGDNFDHGPLGFVGGGYMGQVQTGGRPIQTTHVPPGTPKWGGQWKSAVRDNYLSTVTPGTGVHGSFYSYRDVYLDLDPTYKDRFGRPMMRMTIDFHDNELKQNAYLTDKFAEIIRAMGAHTLDKMYRKGPYDATDLPFRKRCPHFLILRAASYSSASTRKSLTERKFVVGAASKMSKLQMIESRLSNECLP